ncbi:3-oxoacyl-ACP reductase [Candidatus Desulfarcum epimagneticum]|uniref:3-oxoacyl-ACP reductase n=1 Tax=uncultured Desulfobacteraceae bacterium TaxID=218296 RepID=A0A484HHR5_9BACT|nr:3-oxoacyl-ACP reductase [uncultured Desulfobacteraceae bacterium]
MNLKNKAALVLGAVRGIGKGIGLALAERGVKTTLNYFDWEEDVARLKEDFRRTGQEHMIVQTDLCRTGAVSEMVERAVKRFGRLDILINNIERGGWPVVHGAYTQKQWDLEMAVTLRAKQWVFESALPHLKKSGDGAVVNISSIAGIVGRSGPAGYVFNEGYSAASRGVSLLTETWARMGAPEVRVNEIMLGMVETRHGPGTRGWGLLSKAQKKALMDHIPAGRMGTIEDVAKAALFVIKDAPYMTGAVLRLDGGYVLGGEKIPEMPPGVV